MHLIKSGTDPVNISWDSDTINNTCENWMNTFFFSVMDCSGSLVKRCLEIAVITVVNGLHIIGMYE